MSTVGFRKGICHNQLIETSERESSAGFNYNMDIVWCHLKYIHDENRILIAQGTCDFVCKETDCPNYEEKT